MSVNNNFNQSPLQGRVFVDGNRRAAELQQQQKQQQRSVSRAPQVQQSRSFGFGGGGYNPFQSYFQQMFQMMQQMMQQFFNQYLPKPLPAPYPTPNPVPTPTPNPMPTPTPGPNPNFTPGSLAIGDVPVDADGNLDAAFLAAMLTPTTAVNTNLFDAADPSGLSNFARTGIRMMGHDLLDGRIDGDVALRTLFNPSGSDNTAFTGSAETLNNAKEWGRRDLNDDGVLNGSVYGQLIEDVWPHTDDVSIPGFADRLNYKTADLNVETLFEDAPSHRTQAGFDELASKTGVQVTQMLNYALWGHRILDEDFTTQQIAQGALNDPTNIDFGFTHLNQQNIDFVTGLTTDPGADQTVGLDVLNMLLRHLR